MVFIFKALRVPGDRADAPMGEAATGGRINGEETG
jgi:hypothetical protein